MKVIDVLGMHITDYPIKEAIKHALKYIGNGAMNTIFYVSSPVLLEAGENQQQREWLESMDMLLYGEPTVLDVLGENTRERKNEIKQDASQNSPVSGGNAGTIDVSLDQDWGNW